MDQKPIDLDYATPTSGTEPTALNDFFTGLFVGRLRSKWLYLQLAYYLALAGVFVAIAFYLGPNYYLVGRFSSVTPADFVGEVQQEGVPVVRAMKEFQRDHGRLPQDANELVPKYLPPSGDNAVWFDVRQGVFAQRARWNHRIWYDFSPGTEGWYVAGHMARGRIPLPPVKVTATTRPTTQAK